MAEVSTVIPELLRALDLTGVLANALLGGVVARQHRLDPVGFGVLAILSGLGGGVIRDVLLQRGTPVALTDFAFWTLIIDLSARSSQTDMMDARVPHLWGLLLSQPACPRGDLNPHAQ